jgi:hypothetical protein
MGVPTAWQSLDEDDSDPVRFLEYVAAAVAEGQESAGTAMLAMLRSPLVELRGPDLLFTPSEAATWAQGFRVTEATELGLLSEREMLSVARLRFALGELDDAVKLLDALGKEAEPAGRFGVAIEAHTLAPRASLGPGSMACFESRSNPSD